MGRKAGLAVADVVSAGAAIADEEGMDAVTLAAVAGRLGVRSPSLYAHVSGLDGLRRMLALHAAGQMAAALESAVRGYVGLEALRRAFTAYRGFAIRHPGLYAAAQRAVKPGEDDELYAALGRVIGPTVRALAEAGVREDDRIHLTRALRSALHGFVVLERAGGFGRAEPLDESFRRLQDLLMAGVRASAAPPA